jgi:hypothetical protein
MRETADIDESNNAWPQPAAQSKFQIFKTKQEIKGPSNTNNPMQKAAEKEKKPF